MGMCGTDVGCHIWFNFCGMKLLWMHNFTFLHFIGVDAVNNCCRSYSIHLYINRNVTSISMCPCVCVCVCLWSTFLHCFAGMPCKVTKLSGVMVNHVDSTEEGFSWPAFPLLPVFSHHFHSPSQRSAMAH